MIRRGLTVLTVLVLVGVSGSPGVGAETDSPVVVGGKTLFAVKARVVSFSPEDRARLITARIARLAKDQAIPADAVTVVDDATATDIVAGDVVIMAVTDQDARAEGRPREVVAQDHARAIRQAIGDLRREASASTLFVRLLSLGLASLLLVAVMVVLYGYFPRMHGRIEDWVRLRVGAIRLQSVEIASAARLTSFLTGLGRVVRAGCAIVAIYFYAVFALSVFPQTRHLAPELVRYAANPLEAAAQGFTRYLPNLIFIAVVVLLTRYFIQALHLVFGEIRRGRIQLRGFYPEWAEPTFKITRFLVIAFALVVAFPYVPGSDSPAFKGVSIFLGVLFSLGSTSAVANVVAGTILTYMRAFRLGDRVRIAGTEGDVIEKTLLLTRVRTIKNVDVTIPNALILGAHIENFSAVASEQGLILHTSVTIGYDAPWRTVHELLIAAARATEHIRPSPAPFVLQRALNDFYVAYEVNAYTDAPRDMAAIYSDLHQNIQDRFNEAGVEIMSPHYTQIRDGNTTAIPAEHQRPGYVPSALRVARVDDGERRSGR